MRKQLLFVALVVFGFAHVSTKSKAAAASLINLGDRADITARRPILIAHRGGVVTPHSAECSREAIRLAGAQGYDMVELDIRRSKDGIPIVFHDPSLQKACGRSASTSELHQSL